MVTVCRLTLKVRTFCPQSALIFLWILEQTAIIFLYIKCLVFITEMGCVYCAVGTECVIQVTRSLYLKCLNSSVSCHNLIQKLQLPCLLPPVSNRQRTLKRDMKFTPHRLSFKGLVKLHIDALWTLTAFSLSDVQARLQGQVIKLARKHKQDRPDLLTAHSKIPR